MVEPRVVGVMGVQAHSGDVLGGPGPWGGILGSLHGEAWAYTGLVEVAAHHALT